MIIDVAEAVINTCYIFHHCTAWIWIDSEKKDMNIKHLLTAALIVSATVVATAQQTDTTKTQQQPRSGSQEQSQSSNQFNEKNYSQLQATDVPANLRTTLQGDEYKGWESGKVYRANNGDGYYLTTGSGNTAKNFYFDKSGKVTKSPEDGTKPRDN